MRTLCEAISSHVVFRNEWDFFTQITRKVFEVYFSQFVVVVLLNKAFPLVLKLRTLSLHIGHKDESVCQTNLYFHPEPF